MSDADELLLTILHSVDQPLRFRVLDSIFDVSDLPERMRVQLVELLLPFLAPGDMPAAPALTFGAAWDESTRQWNVMCDGKMLNGVPTEEAALLQLEWRITSAGVDRVEGCGVFHAGALVRGDATVLLQGESGAGKTTLTLGLMARGWLPLADDVAIVDMATLGLRVFPRCFHVEHPDQRPAEACPPLAPISALEGHARPLHWAAEGRQPTAIVTVARNADLPSSLTPLVRAQAAGALLAGAIHTQISGSQVAELAARLAATVHYCGHLNNSNLPLALDLIEAACAI